MKQIEFEGQTHQFPDDFTDADIASALGGPKSAPRSIDTTGRLKAAIVPSPQQEELGKNTAVSRALFGNTVGSWDTPGRVVRAVGDMIIPGTNAQAGAMAGTMVVPAAAATPYVPTAVRSLAQSFPALARIFGATVGGGAGGALEGGALGAVEGAAKGGIAATAGEGIGKLFSTLARGLPGAKSAIAADDASRYGAEMGRQSSPLAGAKSAEDLRRMAAGGGQEALGKARDVRIADIEQRLNDSTRGGYERMGEIRVPSAAQVGTGAASVPRAAPTTVRTGLYNESEVALPGMAGRVPIRVGPDTMTFGEANAKLSEIGAKAFSKNPLDRNFNGIDQRRLYGAVYREIKAGLDERDPSGALSSAFENAQQEYAAGLALLRPLQRSNAFRTGEELQFNTPALQRLTANPKFEANTRGKLGDAGFESLRDTLLRGGKPGEADILAPGGNPLDALMEILRGKGGATQIPALIPRTLLPNLGSKYAGRQPYAMPEKLQTILDLATERVTP